MIFFSEFLVQLSRDSSLILYGRYIMVFFGRLSTIFCFVYTKSKQNMFKRTVYQYFLIDTSRPKRCNGTQVNYIHHKTCMQRATIYTSLARSRDTNVLIGQPTAYTLTYLKYVETMRIPVLSHSIICRLNRLFSKVIGD